MSATSPSPYAVGQLWRCQGRSDGERPVLLINRIDQHPLGGEILHVSIREAQIRHPAMPGGVMTSMPHVPVIGQVFERSGAELIGQDTPDPAYIEGYQQWKPAFDGGHAGSYGIAVAEILDIVEGMLAKRHPH